MGTDKKKLSVPMGTGWRPDKKFSGTDEYRLPARLKNCGYRWLPGTGQKKIG